MAIASRLCQPSADRLKQALCDQLRLKELEHTNIPDAGELAKLPISKLGYIERDGMKRGLNAQCPRFHMCPCFVYDTMTHICSVSWVTLGHALYKKASNQQSLQWLTVTGGAEREVWNVQL